MFSYLSHSYRIIAHQDKYNQHKAETMKYKYKAKNSVLNIDIKKTTFTLNCLFVFKKRAYSNNNNTNYNNNKLYL